jgi:hypothetical protein
MIGRARNSGMNSAPPFFLWRLSNMAAPYCRKFLLRRSVTMPGWRNVKGGTFRRRPQIPSENLCSGYYLPAAVRAAISSGTAVL